MATRSASVLARLLALARERGDDYSLLLNRFGLERWLHRLSVSRHSQRFLLKGALLFSLWYEAPHRPTRDADLLGFGSDDADDLTATFGEIAAIELNDGIRFDTASVRAESIREDNAYGGIRIRLAGYVGSARCALQIDVGFGDAVIPGPQTVAFPTLLADFDAPSLRVYPVYSVIAEKYHAMVLLGLANSRMKDFYDLGTIAARSELEGSILASAIGATFDRRGMPLPVDLPMALTQDFAAAAAKQRQWQAFLQRNRLPAMPLGTTVGVLHDLLWPATQVAASGSSATARWNPTALKWT